MNILEDVAIHQYRAQWLLIDTGTYRKEMRPDGWFQEFIGEDDFKPRWYQARGYEIYKVSFSVFHSLFPPMIH